MISYAERSGSSFEISLDFDRLNGCKNSIFIKEK